MHLISLLTYFTTAKDAPTLKARLILSEYSTTSVMHVLYDGSSLVISYTFTVLF